MHKTALVLALLLPTLAAAAPKTLWDLDYRLDTYKKKPTTKAYVLQPHGGSNTPMTYADATNAIDTQVQKGEWVIDNLWPVQESEDLRARVFKRGGVLVPWTAVVLGTIIDAPFQPTGELTDGYVSSMKVAIKNQSPYKLRVKRLIFTSCVGAGIVNMTTPLVLDPTSTKQVVVTIDHREAPSEQTASCADTGGWNKDFFVEYGQ